MINQERVVAWGISVPVAMTLQKAFLQGMHTGMASCTAPATDMHQALQDVTCQKNSSVTADINGRKTFGVLHASALIQQVHNGWEVCHGGDSLDKFTPVYLGDAKGGMTYLGKPALLIQ